MSDEEALDELRRSTNYNDVRRKLHQIEDEIDYVSQRLDGSFDPACEMIATGAMELRREIGYEDVEVDLDE